MINIDEKYEYLLSRVALPEDRDNFILRNGLNSIEVMYKNFLRKGIEDLGAEAIGKTPDEILETVMIASPVKMSDNFDGSVKQ